MITLQQLLQSRDERAARQETLLSGHPGKTLVCLTVIPPGSEKRTDLETGYEAYFLVDGTPLEVKLLCCGVEDTHPWGRLMDIDVLEPGPGGAVPLSRNAVGLPPRRCLVCDRPARECMRERAHSLEQLQERIKYIYDSGGTLS